MRGVVAALSLVLVVLSGCSGGEGGGADGDTSFEDFDVEVTATTGAIRGVVVDERITPIPDATVKLTGSNTEQSATTDTEGRFAFSNLAPGTYFLAVSALLHSPSQTSVDVVAGVADPPITKVLLSRLFDQQPFTEQTKIDGFIQCNQAGIVYASAPCITDVTGLAGGTANGTVPGCTASGCAPQLRRVLTEQRGFRTSVGPGWQVMLLEMVWEESSETFERMGITFSFNETQRPASHWYARSDSTSPLRMEMRVGVAGPDEQIPEGTPELIPAEGHSDLYYFVGVRSSGGVPAVAVNQPFQLFTTYFYYGLPPEGWSVVNGDTPPF